MFGFGEKRRRREKMPIGIGIEFTLNLVALASVGKKLEPPVTADLSEHWLEFNCQPYKTNVTWLMAHSGESFLVTEFSPNFHSDTPFSVPLPDNIKGELILEVIGSLMILTYEGCCIGDIPFEYFNKLIVGDKLMSAYDPREELRGESFEDDYPALYGDREVVVQTRKTLYPHAFKLKNSVLEIWCGPLDSVVHLVEHGARLA